MSEGKYKKRPKNKITAFPVYREDLENPDMDQFLRESIMAEADELEARLNSDPKLAGISASDDMFDMIVGKLKAQGVWEEDGKMPEENPVMEDMDTADDIMEDGSAGIRGNRDTDIKADTEENSKEAINVNSKEDFEEFTGADSKEMFEEIRPEEETINAGKNDVTSEEYTETATEKKKDAELAKLYEEQPEEVMRLVERGRKAEQEEKERTRRRMRRNRFVRRATAVAAAFVLVIGVGVSTEASRGWILKMWDAAMEGFGFKVKTNYVGDGVRVRQKSEEELNALTEIEENINVSVPDFAYLPDGMEFLEYEKTEGNWEARLFYTYQERIFSIAMIKLQEEGANYFALDNDVTLVDQFVHSQGSTIEIWENSGSENVKSYVAELEYEGCRYVFIGTIPLEEMKKILEFMIIL